MLQTDLYRNEFTNMLHNKREAQHTLAEGYDTSTGGYRVPADMTRAFQHALAKECLFRRYATRQHLDQADGTIITMVSTGNAGIVKENEAYPQESDRFTKVRYGSYKLASLCKISHAFLSDTKLDVEAYLVNEFARRFGRAEEKVLLTGSGTDEPLGLIQQTASTVTTDATGIAFDDIIKLYFSLEAEYRTSAVWIMNDETAVRLRMLKDELLDRRSAWKNAMSWKSE